MAEPDHSRRVQSNPAFPTIRITHIDPRDSNPHYSPTLTEIQQRPGNQLEMKY